MGLEDTVLFLIAQAGVEREHLGMTQIRVTQLLADLPDVAFPGKEYQDIAGPLALVAFVILNFMDNGLNSPGPPASASS